MNTLTRKEQASISGHVKGESSDRVGTRRRKPTSSTNAASSLDERSRRESPNSKEAIAAHENSLVRTHNGAPNERIPWVHLQVVSDGLKRKASL